MLATNHVLAGSIIGAAVGDPIAGFGLGVLSHLVMDAIPHWGVDSSSSKGYSTYLKVAVCDGLLLLVLGTLIVLGVEPQYTLAVAAGAFGALLPDLDKPWELFFGKLTGRTLWPAWFNNWNVRIQRESPRRWWVELGGFLLLGSLVYLALLA